MPFAVTIVARFYFTVVGRIGWQLKIEKNISNPNSLEILATYMQSSKRDWWYQLWTARKL